MHKDSRTILDSLNNAYKHTYLNEEIRQKVHVMEIREWRIGFRWTKDHAVSRGNELADKLAKEASGKTKLHISYNRVTKNAITKGLEGKYLETWQRDWGQHTNGA